MRHKIYLRGLRTQFTVFAPDFAGDTSQGKRMDVRRYKSSWATEILSYVELKQSTICSFLHIIAASKKKDPGKF
jgi:hypothetical protein